MSLLPLLLETASLLLDEYSFWDNVHNKTSLPLTKFAGAAASIVSCAITIGEMCDGISFTEAFVAFELTIVGMSLDFIDPEESETTFVSLEGYADCSLESEGSFFIPDLVELSPEQLPELTDIICEMFIRCTPV
mmetsp:Transcript_21022/g.45526  ORF Transcript_21022/g.45526 Transcript_21022/m.45526 type:complete len:134 (+) Transcript_21022:1284-1685(+)